MVYDVVREYPDLGSFLYGHWETIELGTVAFLIFCGVLLIGLLTTLAGGVIGYVLQSVALCRIAKRYGAGKRLRTKACLPFVRYFAIGKMAERRAKTPPLGQNFSHHLQHHGADCGADADFGWTWIFRHANFCHADRVVRFDS